MEKRDMINFKKETIEKINGREIDEFFLYYDVDVYLDDESSSIKPEIYSGKGEIDWNILAEKFCLKELHPHMYGDDIFKYDDGYGQQYFFGWITFKRTNQWIQRKEYDGNEWWEDCKKPSLADMEIEDEGN